MVVNNKLKGFIDHQMNDWSENKAGIEDLLQVFGDGSADENAFIPSVVAGLQSKEGHNKISNEGKMNTREQENSVCYGTVFLADQLLQRTQSFSLQSLQNMHRVKSNSTQDSLGDSLCSLDHLVPCMYNDNTPDTKGTALSKRTASIGPEGKVHKRARLNVNLQHVGAQGDGDDDDDDDDYDIGVGVDIENVDQYKSLNGVDKSKNNIHEQKNAPPCIDVTEAWTDNQKDYLLDGLFGA